MRRSKTLCVGMVVMTLNAVVSATTLAGQNEVQFGFDQGPSACRFAGEFTQTKQVSGITEPIESRGLFLYDCQSGVIWSVQQPESDTLVLRLAQNADQASSQANSQASHRRDTTRHEENASDAEAPVTKKATTKRPITKSRAYRIFGGEVQRLKHRQSQFLTQLMMSLMGGDKRALEKQFEILPTPSSVSSAVNGVRLVPKQRGLKRAIKQIDVTAGDNVNGVPIMRISMTDRNGQTTTINAQRNADNGKGADLTEWSTASCAQASLPIQACERLFDTVGGQ